MPNLATNHIVRVAPILKALQRNHDVDLIGVLKQGEELFPPFAHEFDYRIVTWNGRGGFLGTVREVEGAIRGPHLRFSGSHVQRRCGAPR